MNATKEHGSLAALKRRIKVGTVLRCIENTYRPELNDKRRVVTKTAGNSFCWQTVGKEAEERNSWTYYPKAAGLSWLNEDEFKMHLFDDHYVTLLIER